MSWTKDVISPLHCKTAEDRSGLMDQEGWAVPLILLGLMNDEGLSTTDVGNKSFNQMIKTYSLA